MDASSGPWQTRIQILIAIAIALGLAAIVTAASVYRNEYEEHKATQDFHAATHYLVSAAGAGITSPRGKELEALFRAGRPRCRGSPGKGGRLHPR